MEQVATHETNSVRNTSVATQDRILIVTWVDTKLRFFLVTCVLCLPTLQSYKITGIGTIVASMVRIVTIMVWKVIIAVRLVMRMVRMASLTLSSPGSEMAT